MSASSRPAPGSWTVPALSAFFGLVYLAAGVLGGRPLLGVAGLGVMLVFAAVLLLAGRRSETVRGLLDRRDERINRIDLTATAAAGTVLVVAVIVAGVVEIARGGSGSPYTWLAALAGLAYVASVVVQRLRG